MVAPVQQLTIADLKQQAGATPMDAAVHVQLQRRSPRTTRKGDPYLELEFADTGSSFRLKAWSNHPQFGEVEQMRTGTCLALQGSWTQNEYGIDSAGWSLRPLDDGEREQFLAGDPKTQARQRQDWEYIRVTVGELRDPRLLALGERFLKEFGERFRRAAAARRNHHARRGGLVEHVAQMMRSARALCTVYRDLNEDLLVAGVLFHDCGKLWENNYPETGFAQNHSIAGEMMGHIPLGIELVNKLWRDLMEDDASANWLTLEPASDHVRLHLLHLIASHHGEYEFGSPTLPRSPEAFTLHYVDNLDAKYEMVRMAYEAAPELAPGLYERQFPLPANLVAPLPSFEG